MTMKHLVAAAIAALTLGASALPAAAQDFHNGYGGGYGGGYGQIDRDWHGRGAITVRTMRGQFTVDRGDRLFYRLVDRPYNFRPGMTYVYTDRCFRGGCQVLVFSRYDRRPVDRIFAPFVRFDQRDWRGDNPWDRGDNWQRDDNRDGRGDYNRGNDGRGDWRH